MLQFYYLEGITLWRIGGKLSVSRQVVYPKELNRQAVIIISNYNYAPTEYVNKI